GSRKKRSGKDDLARLVECLLPTVRLCAGSIDQLWDMPTFDPALKMLAEVSHGFDDACTSHKAKPMLGVRKFKFSDGNQRVGRMYAWRSKESGKEVISVLIGNKHSQPFDIDWIKKNVRS